MAAIRFEHLQTIQKTLETYIDASAGYVIACETASRTHQDTSGQHMHFAVEMEDKQYDAFRKTVLVKQYNLRGQAKNGQPRQYGRIKDIRSETKFLAYTVKDKNIVYKNISLDVIQKALDDSYKKEDKKDFQTTLMEYLLQPCNQNQIVKIFSENQGFRVDIHKLEILILKYHIDNVDKPLCLSRLRYYTNLYLQKHNKLVNTNEDLERILEYLKNRN